MKEFLQNNAILIGSRAFGLHSSTSDWDYVLAKHKLKDFAIMYGKYKMDPYYLDDYDGQLPMGNIALFKFTFEGHRYEVLIFNTRKANAFTLINTLFREIMKTTESVRRKDVRVKVYNTLMQAVFAAL